MFLATTVVNLVPSSGIWDQIFHQSFITVNILGLLNGQKGISINLIGLIIVAVVGIAAVGITERLTGGRMGGSLLLPIILTILGAYVFIALLGNVLTFDVVLEGIHLVAALLGAIVFAVFYVLIRGRGRSTKAA